MQIFQNWCPLSAIWMCKYRKATHLKSTGKNERSASTKTLLFTAKYINSHKRLDIEPKNNQFLLKYKRISKCKSVIYGSTVQSEQTMLVDSSFKDRASEMLFLTILIQFSILIPSCQQINTRGNSQIAL